jgi:aminocarboxymuconate-semialdehyde decarboxylase
MKHADLPLVVDFHAHTLTPEAFKASTNKTVFTGFGARPGAPPRPGIEQIMNRQFDPKLEIEDMDQRGIDMAVIHANSVQQGTSWADPQTDLEMCRKCNDQAADWVARYPKRFVGSIALPLQDAKRAIGELERGVKSLKLRVANISSSYNGVYMGDPVYHPFWEAVNAMGVTVWIHPEGVKDPWFQNYSLWNSLGQSIEETKCMTSLIYEGVLTKYPDLKIVMAHGGGYFPHYLGRLDRNTVNRPDTVRNTGGKTPSAFLRSFHYDTCVYDPKVFRVLLERVGADRLVMGSDYPVGERDPVQWVRDTGVTGTDLVNIVGGNAARLLGIPARAA